MKLEEDSYDSDESYPAGITVDSSDTESETDSESGTDSKDSCPFVVSVCSSSPSDSQSTEENNTDSDEEGYTLVVNIPKHEKIECNSLNFDPSSFFETEASEELEEEALLALNEK